MLDADNDNQLVPMAAGQQVGASQLESKTSAQRIPISNTQEEYATLSKLCTRPDVSR